MAVVAVVDISCYKDTRHRMTSIVTLMTDAANIAPYLLLGGKLAPSPPQYNNIMPCRRVHYTLMLLYLVCALSC